MHGYFKVLSMRRLLPQFNTLTLMKVTPLHGKMQWLIFTRTENLKKFLLHYLILETDLSNLFKKYNQLKLHFQKNEKRIRKSPHSIVTWVQEILNALLIIGQKSNFNRKNLQKNRNMKLTNRNFNHSSKKFLYSNVQ